MKRTSCSYIKLLINLSIIFLFHFTVFGYSQSVENLDSESNQKEGLFDEASEAYKNGNYISAFEKFKTLSELGIHDAQYNLAVILKAGKGVPKDYSEALFWSWRARLGQIGLAIQQSEELIEYIPEKSLKELRKRVEDALRIMVFDGESSAVGRMAKYFLVIPADPDYEKAYLWFLVSAALSQEGAIEGRDEVEIELDSEKVVKIQKEAYELYLSLPESVKNNLYNGDD